MTRLDLEVAVDEPLGHVAGGHVEDEGAGVLELTDPLLAPADDLGRRAAQVQVVGVAGVAVDNDGRLRDSMPMAEEDWELVDRALEEISTGAWPTPNVIALEYGGEGVFLIQREDLIA